MTPTADQVKGKRALVVGLGRSGLAAARRLLSDGALVTCTDTLPLEKLPREAQLLAGAGVTLHCGGHVPSDFLAAEYIVLSPGVPQGLPELAAAIAAGVPYGSEIDLVARRVGPRVIAITGSNGKSTATKLAGEMLAAAGREGVACANYGLPFCEAANGDHEGRWYAAELSSFQLDITFELQAAAAVLLNVQADHIDRHGSFAAYRASKERIAELRAPGAPVVLAVDDESVAEFAARTAGPVLQVSVERPVAEGGCVSGGRLVLRLGGHEDVLADVAELPVPGRHNRINILAAAVACRAAGVPLEPLHRAVVEFRPLRHRIEEVAQVDGVRYVDDSKATNVGAVLEAIRAIGETIKPGQRVYVLLGGRDKDSDFRPLVPVMSAAGAVAITFGEAGPLIADVLAREKFVNLHRSGTLLEATGVARGLARPGDVVLLSPACASFDAFTGYAARGDAFAAEARRFAGERG